MKKDYWIEFWRSYEVLKEISILRSSVYLTDDQAKIAESMFEKSLIDLRDDIVNLVNERENQRKSNE